MNCAIFEVSGDPMMILRTLRNEKGAWAVQKNSEKTVLARTVQKETAGREIGRYHVWTSVAAAIVVIATGYLIDFLTIGSIFYLASIVFAWSGFYIMKLEIVK